MRTQLAIIAALGASGLSAQDPPKVIAHQRSAWFAGGEPATMIFDSSDGQTVTGKPFSAKEEHHTLQVLGDGTRIERKESNTYYRDDQGRTRVEHTGPAGTFVTISDPVAGHSIILDSNTKTARKLSIPKGASFRITGGAGGGVMAGAVAVRKDSHGDAPMAKEARTDIVVTAIPHAAPRAGTIAFGPMAAAKTAHMAEPSKEDLGTNVINGVSAEGTRTTFTIPAGQIGNDREIRTVTERWYSSDLQMLVKSSTSDPRFGDTTYELTNIVRAAPDPALFQVPADYTVREMGKPPLP